MPVMTMSFSTSGGLVMLEPSIVSTTGTSQSGWPVRASSAISMPSSVPTNIRLPRMATPRANGLISYGLTIFCCRVQRQI